MKVRLSFVAAAAAALLACSEHGAPGAGEEKGPCYSNGTCNQGLSCFSNRCVRYVAGAGDGGLAGSGGGGAETGGDGADGLAGATGSGGSQGPGDASAGSDAAGSGGVAGTTGTAGNGGTAGTAGTKGDGGMTGAAGMGGAAGATSAGGATGAAGMVGCAGTNGGTGATPEEITVPACGNTPGTTSSAYGGLVTMTVSGLIVNTPGNPLEDAFYGVDANNTSLATAACPDCFRYNRLQEGVCLCSSECATTSHRVSDLLVGPYPAFRSGHDYTVTLDLGKGAPERLNFGIHDCGCADNSGTHRVTLTPAPNACGSSG